MSSAKASVTSPAIKNVLSKQEFQEKFKKYYEVIYMSYLEIEPAWPADSAEGSSEKKEELVSGLASLAVATNFNIQAYYQC